MSPRAPAPGARRAGSDAQQGLPLVVPSRGSVGRVAIEASTPCSGAFDGDEWLFSVDWEGSRCLLVANGDRSMRLQGETAALDARFPEIASAAAFLGNRGAVLDGSICVLDSQGRPDLAALARRAIRGETTPAAVYLATDVLRLDGDDLTRQPLVARLATLAELIPPDSRVQVPDHVVGHGRALAGAARSRGLPAILARHRDAGYLAGMASPQRLRIAVSGRRDAVVLGWRSTARGLRLLLGDWVLGRLRLVGVAPLDDPSRRRWLAGAAEPVPAIPVDDADAAGPGVTWIRPRLVATVEPVSGPPRRGLAAWRLVVLRDDVDPMWCVRRQPVEPPQVTAHEPLRPFSPTVLSPLEI